MRNSISKFLFYFFLADVFHFAFFPCHVWFKASVLNSGHKFSGNLVWSDTVGFCCVKIIKFLLSFYWLLNITATIFAKKKYLSRNSCMSARPLHVIHPVCHVALVKCSWNLNNTSVSYCLFCLFVASIINQHHHC